MNRPFLTISLSGRQDITAVNRAALVSARMADFLVATLKGVPDFHREIT
jgi:hypothetical protein